MITYYVSIIGAYPENRVIDVIPIDASDYDAAQDYAVRECNRRNRADNVAVGQGYAYRISEHPPAEIEGLGLRTVINDIKEAITDGVPEATAISVDIWSPWLNGIRDRLVGEGFVLTDLPGDVTRVECDGNLYQALADEARGVTLPTVMLDRYAEDRL